MWLTATTTLLRSRHPPLGLAAAGGLCAVGLRRSVVVVDHAQAACRSYARMAPRDFGGSPSTRRPPAISRRANNNNVNPSTASTSSIRINTNNNALTTPNTPPTAATPPPPPPPPLTPVMHLAGLPVRLPPQRATRDDIIPDTDHPAASVLTHPAIVIGRQLEMINVLIGFEQANKYSIKDPAGNDVGFMAEEESSFSGTILRQLMRTRRALKVTVLDARGTPVLEIRRPVKWLLNSHIEIRDCLTDSVIGEVKQELHLWRRRYHLFDRDRVQFARIDAPILAWDFDILGRASGLLARISRSFSGFAREIFTDTGVYAIQFDALHDGNAQAEEEESVSLDRRAVLLACAVNIDVDYFSRHSSSGGVLPIPAGGAVIPAGGGGVVTPPVPIIIPGGGMGGAPVDGTSSAPVPPPGGGGGLEGGGGGGGGGGAWEGDDGFLTDEQAGVSTPSDSEATSSILKNIWDAFNDN